MNFQRLKLRQLQCLVVVAQERNLVRAAGVLALTQSAVSKSLAELEDIVGRPLLIRHARGVELTPAGQVLLDHAGAGMRLLRDGLDHAVQQPEPDRATVIVGALPNLTGTLLPDALTRLQEELPISLTRIATGTNAQLLAQLRRGDIDAVFGRLAEPSEMIDLCFEKLFDEPMVLVARAHHPLASCRRVGAGALEQHRLIVPIAGTVIRRVVDNFLLEKGRRYPDQIIETLDNGLASALVQRSDAVWFAPQGAAQLLLDRGELVRLAIDTRGTHGPVGLSMRMAFAPNAPLARLLAITREMAALAHPSEPVRRTRA
jgi:LysR family transcriptional regulator, pca operon transcriptional activator